MAWEIKLTKRALKQVEKLPLGIRERVYFLLKEMKSHGPYLETWPELFRLRFKNYGKLSGFENKYHCHLKKGKPTYIACWEIHKKVILVEFYYVGTHEKAPY